MKSQKEGCYWHACDLVVFLNPKLHPVWRIVAISLYWIWAAGLHHQWIVKCPYQQQKEPSSFSKEEQNSNCNFPANRLSDVQVSGRAARIKLNLLSNNNSNNNVILKCIRKDGWARSQEIWTSTFFGRLDPTLWPCLPKAIPNSGYSRVLAHLLSKPLCEQGLATGVPWGHVLWDSWQHSLQGPAPAKTELVACFSPCCWNWVCLMYD